MTNRKKIIYFTTATLFIIALMAFSILVEWSWVAYLIAWIITMCCFLNVQAKCNTQNEIIDKLMAKYEECVEKNGVQIGFNTLLLKFISGEPKDAESDAGTSD